MLEANFLKHKECKGLDDAEQKGEALDKIYDYHILSKNGKVALVYHLISYKCDFCNLEKDEEKFIFI